MADNWLTTLAGCVILPTSQEASLLPKFGVHTLGLIISKTKLVSEKVRLVLRQVQLEYAILRVTLEIFALR